MTAIRTSTGTVTPEVELRRTLVIVGAIVCFETVLFSTLAPLLAEHFALSKIASGALVSMYAAGAFLGSFASGVAAARFGPKATALGGLGLLGASLRSSGMKLTNLVRRS